MGFFKKFISALNDAVNEKEEKKEEETSVKPKNTEAPSVREDYSNDYDDDDDDYEGDLSEDDFNAEYDEDDYDISEIEAEDSDEDLQELGRAVDSLIEAREGNLTGSDIEELHGRALQSGLSIEEFDAILNSRIEELRYAIEAGYEPRVVYRTRSIWRRCPNCGWLNSADDVYCEWCGYQLRYKAASYLLATLVASGARGNARKLHSRHVQKSVKKANKGRKARKTVKPKANRTLSAPKKHKPATPLAKKKPLFSSSSSAKPVDKKKSMFGSSSSSSAKPVEKKKSLFGSSSSSSSSKPVEKKKSLFGSSSSSSSSKPKKSGGLLGGAKKSSGFGLGKKRR